MISKQEFDERIEDAHNLKLKRFKEVEVLFLNKKFCLFGYGNKGRHLAKQLRARNIEFAVYDSNAEALKKAVADGFKIIEKISEADKNSYCFVLSSGQYQLQQQMVFEVNYIYIHECTYYFDLPHIQSGTRAISDIILERRDDFFRTYQIVHPFYKNVFLGILLYRASLNPIYLQPIKSNLNEMWLDVPSNHIKDNYKSLCDVGAFDGDTILAFSNRFDIKNAVAVEVNTEFNSKIILNSSKLVNGVKILPFAAWSEMTNLSYKEDSNGMFSVYPDENGEIRANALDNLVKSEVEVLKFDIEGSELQALQGARSLIQNQSPDIFLAAYHRPEDFFELPDFIFDVAGKEMYELCVGHYSDVFDDTIFYFIKSTNIHHSIK